MRGEVEVKRQGWRLGLPEPKRRTGQKTRSAAGLGHKAGPINAHYLAPGGGPKRKDHMNQTNRISEGKWPAPALSLNPSLANLDLHQAESQKIKVNQSGSK
jgi:hypothetical protein